MFKISSVKINNFWHKFNVYCNFNDEVNIIIGKNGSGKTTFMNILHAILAVDIDGINNNNFESVEIKLKNGNKRKTIKAKKIENEQLPFVTIEYQISQQKHYVRIISTNDHRLSPTYRRRAIEESESVRNELAKIVSLSSLSVYRLRNGHDYEIRDGRGTRVIAPVDYRLSELLTELTHYQLDLSQKARETASRLQKDVLASILYNKEDAESNSYALDFDKDKERHNLVAAYSRLGAIDNEIRKKINFHVMSIDETVKKIKERNTNDIDFRSLEALRKTQKIIQLSLIAEEETSKIFSQISLFLEKTKDFISDKNFDFDSGNLKISSQGEAISYSQLSSGEKQLLILFIETLLQRERPFVFLTDEPELSLHIAWQRKIIPAIREINPNAQIIAATHSPEVASKYRDSIFNMEKLVHD